MKERFLSNDLNEIKIEFIVYSGTTIQSCLKLWFYRWLCCGHSYLVCWFVSLVIELPINLTSVVWRLVNFIGIISPVKCSDRIWFSYRTLSSQYILKLMPALCVHARHTNRCIQMKEMEYSLTALTILSNFFYLNFFFFSDYNYGMFILCDTSSVPRIKSSDQINIHSFKENIWHLFNLSI